MENQDFCFKDELPQQAVFALDIGTHSIIGMVGFLEEDKIHVAAIEQMKHTKRAMIDGQIEDISQVARVAGAVKEKLEKRLGCRLTRVAVAAAGRALQTERASYEMELPAAERITAETVSRLEAGAISEAEKAFAGDDDQGRERRFYLVGYSACRYYLDDYVFSSLVDHHGRKLKVDIIATFLPSEVVESLYAAMNKINLEVASLTLEPIAAINAAIPQSIRLLNLAMVDIGAGTSDIAVCRDGSITGYTMAVQAGDEITESIMKAYLVDFQEAERIKSQADAAKEIAFTDIMGFEQTITREQLLEGIKDVSASLCEEICSKIVEVNGGVPSAVFLAGGGSLLSGLKEGIAEKLHIDPKRIAIAGRNFKENAFSEEYDLDNPEYTTPLGIIVSAGLNMIHDSFRIMLNGQQAKLFRSGTFTVMNILMMNGYSYQDMMGRSGQNLAVSINGRRKLVFGEKAEPCVLKLNGQEAQMTTLVRAGDRIDFIPAKHGRNAAARLSQLVDIEDGTTVFVNGETVDSDIALKSGDVIFVEGMESGQEETVDLDIVNLADLEKENENSPGGVSGPAAPGEERQPDVEVETEEKASVASEPGTAGDESEEAKPGMAGDEFEESNLGTAGDESEEAKLGTPEYKAAVSSSERPGHGSVSLGAETAGAEAVSLRTEKLEGESIASEPVKPEGKSTSSRTEAAGMKLVSSGPEKPEGESIVSGPEKPEKESIVSEPKKLEAVSPLPVKPEGKSASSRQETAGVKSAAATVTPAPKQKKASGNTGAGKHSKTEEQTDTDGQDNIQMKLPLDALEKAAESPSAGKKKRASSSSAGKKKSASAKPTGKKDTSGTASNSGEDAAKAASQEAEVPNKLTEQAMMLYLNGECLFLPPKPDGEPYYLMDMLQYSGLDLKNIQNPVALEVNEEDGAFQMELKTGDRVRIYERKPGI